jgi:hypothetical protein
MNDPNGYVIQIAISPELAAIIRGLLLAGTAIAVYLIWSLDRYLRRQFRLIIASLQFMQDRMKPEVRTAEFAQAVRSVMRDGRVGDAFVHEHRIDDEG